ncbi:hypothetical protein [Mycolicibacterium aubagnense]|uniref:hypothetical protein n=1 Tax=Mycolicibacterium aubagnense TaxID=319707 RepID=UPI0013D539D0|nr:hypothetical protein [Mycolicibacterium aubagnense]
MTYNTRAQYVEPGQTAAFLDCTLPDELFCVPVQVNGTASNGARCRITTSEGTSFDVLALCPARIED